MKYFPGCVLFLLLVGPVLSAQDARGVEEAKGLPAGMKAPLFDALDIDGIAYSLESFPGVSLIRIIKSDLR